MSDKSSIDPSLYVFGFDNLSALDRIALEQLLGDGSYTISTPARTPGATHELGTIMIAVGVGLLPTVVGYLFGKREREKVYIEAVRTDPDGTKHSTTIAIDRASVDPVKTDFVSEVLKKLSGS